MSSLVRSNTVLNTMRVYKVFCKSTYSGFDKSTTSRKDKSISKESIYSSKNKVLSLHCNQPATRWLADFSPRKGVLWRSLLLVCWGLSSGYSLTSLVEWKSMLLSPSVTSILVIMASLFTSQVVKEEWLGREIVGPAEWVILSTKLTSSSSAEVILWWSKIQISLY